MSSPAFEKLEELFILIDSCLPIAFGENLPPKLRLRYVNLISEIGKFPIRVRKFQALMTGANYQESKRGCFRIPDPQQPLANFHELDNTFQAMLRLLPHKFVDELPGECRDPYYRILIEHAHLQAKSQRLGEALQQKGLV